MHIKRKSLRRKLVLYIAAASSSIVIIFGICLHQIVSIRLVQDAIENTKKNISNVCEDINNLFYNAYRICESLNDNISMQQMMRIQHGNEQEVYSLDLVGSMELMILPSYNQDIFGVYILGDNGNRFKSNTFSFHLNDFRDEDWYRVIHATGKPKWFLVHESSYVVRTPLNTFFSVGIPFIDKATGHTRGVVLADIEASKIKEYANRVLKKEGKVFILNEKNQIMDFNESVQEDYAIIQQVASLVEKELNEIPEYGVSHVVQDNNYIVVYQTLEQMNWKIVGVMPMSALRDSIHYIQILTVMLIAMAILISVWIAERVTRSVAEPIDHLVEAMEQIQMGNLKITVVVDRTDEIGKLYASFNHMVGEMRQMIDTIYMNQEKLRIEELKALQAQINPHFLYNTLDSIIWSLRMGQVEESIEMLLALTNFFKIGLSKGKDIITIEEEVRHITSYLNIQHYRYQEKFDFDIEVEEGVLSYMTPKLILQPIVENAIYHGVKAKEGKSYIFIRVYEKAEKIVMEVIDTGLGMRSEKVDALNRSFKQSAKQNISMDTGYGTRNVNDKIKIVFGIAYGVFIESKEGEGTTVSICIPKERRDNDESSYM